MKKAIFAASAMMSLIGSAFGCQGGLNPAYSTLALPYMQIKEFKNYAHAYGNAAIRKNDAIQKLQSVRIPSLSEAYNNAFPERDASQIEKIANVMIQSIILSTDSANNAGLSHVLYHLLGAGETAISYDELGSIASIEDFNAACEAATAAKDANKMKLLFGFMGETVDTGSIGNTYQMNASDLANPITVVTAGSDSTLKGSSYADFRVALNILTLDAYERYRSSLNKIALAPLDTMLQNTMASLGITKENIGDMYHKAEQIVKTCLNYKIEQVAEIGGVSQNAGSMFVHLSNGNLEYSICIKSGLSLKGENDESAPLPNNDGTFSSYINIFKTNNNGKELSKDITGEVFDGSQIYDVGYDTGGDPISIGKYIVWPYPKGEGLATFSIDNNTGKLVRGADVAGFNGKAIGKCPGTISQGNHHYLLYAAGGDGDFRMDIYSVEVYKIDNSSGNLVKKTDEYTNGELEVATHQDPINPYLKSLTITNAAIDKSYLIFNSNPQLVVYGINVDGKVFKLTTETNGGHAVGGVNDWCAAIGKYFVGIANGSNKMTVRKISDEGFFVEDSDIQLPFTNTSSSSIVTASISGNQCLLISANNQVCGYTIDNSNGNLVPLTLSCTEGISFGGACSGIGDYMISLKESQLTAYKFIPNEQ